MIPRAAKLGWKATSLVLPVMETVKAEFVNGVPAAVPVPVPVKVYEMGAAARGACIADNQRVARVAKTFMWGPSFNILAVQAISVNRCLFFQQALTQRHLIYSEPNFFMTLP